MNPKTQGLSKSKDVTSRPPAPAGYAEELIRKLDAEILDIEGAMVSARNNGEWKRFEFLSGIQTGLARAKRFVVELQHNVPVSDGANLK